MHSYKYIRCYDCYALLDYSKIFFLRDNCYCSNCALIKDEFKNEIKHKKSSIECFFKKMDIDINRQLKNKKNVDSLNNNKYKIFLFLFLVYRYYSH